MVVSAPGLVEVRNLRHHDGNQLAVKDVSFSFHGGEVLGPLGPATVTQTSTVAFY